MIKNLIFAGVSLLALYLTYVMYKNGINLTGKIPVIKDANVMSYTEIRKQGDTLNANLKQIDTLNHSELPKAVSDVELAKTGFKNKKEEYETLESNASEAEIAEANKKQEYLLDYLWIVIGNYANDNNVRFKMTTDDVNMKIDFDITGSYVSIINFIYDLENDKNLNFNLNGIKMAQTSATGDTTKAYFSVSGIRVITSNSAVN